MLMSPLEAKENRLRVLLVEDDPVTREMIRNFCSCCDMPLDCTAMSSGLEALIDMASIQPDVLIADLNMPGVDGFELLKTLKHSAQIQRMTCLVISALSQEDISAKGGLPDGTLFMAKPVNMQWLNGFFTALIAQRRREQAPVMA
jgi:PleD family two-component response regulator